MPELTDEDREAYASWRNWARAASYVLVTGLILSFFAPWPYAVGAFAYAGLGYWVSNRRWREFKGEGAG